MSSEKFGDNSLDTGASFCSMARQCIFCTEKNVNREDLWPVWIIKSVVGNRSSEIERTVGSAAPFTYGGKYIKARCVCEKCNGGWMCELEHDSKTVLEPMIHDSAGHSISYKSQLTIATWVLKTAMVFECTKRDSAFYSTEDRRHLYKWRTPPPDTFVWIGRLADQALFIENHYLSNANPANALSEGCVTTFAIGCLVLQSFTARRTPNGEGKRITVQPKRGEWDRLLIRIWPAEQAVRWPPPLHFSPSLDSLVALSARLGGHD